VEVPSREKRLFLLSLPPSLSPLSLSPSLPPFLLPSLPPSFPHLPPSLLPSLPPPAFVSNVRRVGSQSSSLPT
jgi:hypothetical protein